MEYFFLLNVILGSTLLITQKAVARQLASTVAESRTTDLVRSVLHRLLQQDIMTIMTIMKTFLATILSVARYFTLQYAMLSHVARNIV